jgi:hypothetical protein
MPVMEEPVLTSIQELETSLNHLKEHLAWIDLWKHETRSGARFSQTFVSKEQGEMKLEMGRFWSLYMRADNDLKKAPEKFRTKWEPELRRLAAQGRLLMRQE